MSQLSLNSNASPPMKRILFIFRNAAMWILVIAGFASVVTATCEAEATQADDPSSSNQAQTLSLSLHVINAEQQPIPDAVIFVRTVPEDQLSRN